MSGIVSRLSVLGKVWLGLAAGALALIVFGLAAPGSSLFFPLVSLWCNAALFALALLVLRRAGVELDLFHKAVLVGLWAAAVLYFYWTLGSRTFLYHWDYVNYILKQYHAEAAFAQSTGAGFRFLLDSITEDYTNFITLFTEFPFCLSGKTGDDYAFCQVFSVLPSLLVLLAGLTVKVGRMLRVKNRFWYFLIGFSWCATFPFVRMSAVLGQPDWFGLIFAFMLMLLTLDYRFDGIDLPRYLLIFAATAGIILTRRWYLYFVVGYCFAYVLMLGPNLLVYIFLPQLSGLYGLTAETTAVVHDLLLWHCIFASLFYPAGFCIPAALRAAGDVRYPMVISVASMLVFRVGLSFVFVRGFGLGVVSIWMAIFVDWGFRAVLFGLRFHSNIWQKKKLL